MKRKILFVAIIAALLACLFAVSAYATEIPEWTEITTVDGMPDKSAFGDDGKAGATSRVLMSDGVTYPAYYICKSSTSLGFSYSDLNSKSGKSYAAKDVVRLEVPVGVTSTPMSALKTENGYTSLLTVSFPEGFVTLGSYTFKATTDIPSALMYVDFPSTLRTIEQYAFVRCNSLKELIIPEGVTSIPKEMASYTPALEKVVFPSTITSIGELAFRSSNLSQGIVIPEGCKTLSNYIFKESAISSIYLPSTLETVGQDICYGCKSITTVVSKSPIIGYRMFYDCDAITSITLENTVEIREQAFNNPDGGILNITELVLPEGLVSIGRYAFARATITELVLPSTLTTMSSYIFTGSTTLQRVVALNSGFGEAMFMNCSALNEVVLTSNFTSFGKDAFSSVSQTSFITYYTGTNYEGLKTICSNTTRITQAKFYSYEDYLSENYTYNKFMVIYDANLCDVAYDGTHVEDGNPCVVNCDRCGTSGVAQANPVHTEAVALAYANGFYNPGTKTTGCTNEGCTHNTVETLPAIFVCLGYSVSDEGNGISAGFAVNQVALLTYEEFIDEKLTFGVVTFNPKYLGSGSVFNDNGVVNTSKGALQISFDLTYSRCNVLVSGINLSNSDHASLELVFAGYAFVGNDKSTIQVFQKDYTGTVDKPVSSPMASKVTRGDDVLYTVKLQSVIDPAQITTGKQDLFEF